MGDASPVSNVPNENIPMPEDNIGEQPLPQDDMIQQGSEMPMVNSNSNPDREKKEIQKNIGKGCADFRNYQGEDKEELQKWIEGMLDSVLDASDASIGEESTEIPEEQPETVPQMESVIFTKKQLNRINEVFGNDEDSKEMKNEKPVEKVDKKKNNSPFSNPKLNIK